MSSRLEASNARRKRSLHERNERADGDDDLDHTLDSALADLRPAKEDESRFRASRQREIKHLNALSAERVAHATSAPLDDEFPDNLAAAETETEARVEIDAALLPGVMGGGDDAGDDEFDDVAWENGDEADDAAVANDDNDDDDEAGAIEVTLDLNAAKRQAVEVGKDGKPKRAVAPRRTKAEKDADLAQHRVHLTVMSAHVDALDRVCDDETLQARLMSLLPPSLVDNCTCRQREMTEQQLLDGDAVNHPATVMLVPLLTYLENHCDAAALERESAALDADGSAADTSDLSSVDKIFAAVYNGVELSISNHRDAVLVFSSLARALGWSTRVMYNAIPHPLEPPKKPKAKSAAPAKRRASASASQPVASKFFDDVSVSQQPVKRRRSASAATAAAAAAPVTVVDEDESGGKREVDSDFSHNPKRTVTSSVIELSSGSGDAGDDDEDDDDAVKKTKTKKKTPAPRKPRAVAPKRAAKAAAAAVDVRPTLYFCQVWCEAQCAWSVVDVVNGVWQYSASRTVPYVLSADHGAVLDETLVYAKDWAASYLLRVSADEDVQWLDDLLAGFARQPRSVQYRAAHARLVARQAVADETMRQTALASVPMPTRVSDFRRHPVYALGRFLTKFQAVHPSTTAGEFRNEPVYWRRNVHMLHTADKWLQEGRAPRAGEQPVKRVTARTRGSKALPSVSIQEARLAEGTRQEEADGGATVGAFGRWQTELYQPPHVVDGKVPRNAYGNVYLFKPEMLPIGGVHLRLPGIRSVASRLGIDAPPAQVGWDTHGGRSFPALDGSVVPAEHEQVLRDAWQAAQEAKNEREAKKRRTKALKNWLALTAAVLQRARIAKAYDDVAPKEQK